MSRDDNFFEVGVTSLLAARFILRLRTTLGTDIPLRAVFENPTVESLATRIDNGLGPASEPDLTWLPRTADLEIKIRDLPLAKAGGRVLLTGATGFFGAFLLRELLRQSDTQINCLVRAENVAEGRERVRSNLAHLGCLDGYANDRVTVTIGDLALPMFGLSDEEFLALSVDTGQIYHAGAVVDALLPFESLRAANVEGTRTVVRLAATSVLKQVHFISTHSAATIGSDSGYSKTKRHAEEIVLSAAGQGVPAAVYRVPRLSHDSVSGIANDKDLAVRLLDNLIAVGAAPDIAFAEPWIPADIAARTVVSKARARPDGGSYVLAPENDVTLAQLMRAAREADLDIQMMPLDAWTGHMRKHRPEEHEIVASSFGIGNTQSSGDKAGGFELIETPGPDEASLLRFFTRRRTTSASH